MLYMAYRAWLLRDKFRVWQICFAGVCGIALTVFSESVDDYAYLAFNGAFLLLYLTAFLWDRFGKAPGEEASEEEREEWAAKLVKNRQFASFLLLGIMALELALNVLNFGVRFSYTTVSNYPKGTGNTEIVLDKMESREEGNLFYRAETTHSQTLNDGALNGYHGVSTFTSSANVKTTEFMQALGYGAKNTYNRYCFEESSPVANLFLGLKYMIERDGEVEESDYFNIVASSGSVYLLENNAYLPLGFLANAELAEANWKLTDVFALQNQLFTAATGVIDDVWSMAPYPEITGNKVTLDSTSRYNCNYSDSQSGGVVSYTFTMNRNGFLCLDFDVTDRNSYTVYLNDEKLYSETLSLRQMIAVSNVGAGDVVRVDLKCKTGEDGRMTVKAGILNSNFFRSGVEILEASTLNLTEFSTTYVSGTIDCNRSGLLYTSIPYDGNWKVYVDGVRVEHTLVGDCMLGVMVTEGQHTVEYVYENMAFSYGWKISAACALVFLITLLVPKMAKKGKYEA